jgi:maltose O-acetyltransferase
MVDWLLINHSTNQPNQLLPPMSRLNYYFNNGWALLRAHWYFRGADQLGKGVRVWGRLETHNWGGRILIGDRVRIMSTVARTEIVASGGTLRLDEGVFINYGCSISASESVHIGPRCTIGTYVIIMDNDFHSLEPERRNEKPPSRPIALEENVWLGARVIVLPGVTIGAGSVIGAGAVVNSSIPARSVAVGVPARVVKTL